LQAALHAHKAEVCAAYAPVATLHDAEARFASQVATLDAHLAEHLTEAAASVSGAALAAGQARLDALRDRVNTQVSDLATKVCLA
jgi:hypothetical protein